MVSSNLNFKRELRVSVGHLSQEEKLPASGWNPTVLSGQQITYSTTPEKLHLPEKLNMKPLPEFLAFVRKTPHLPPTGTLKEDFFITSLPPCMMNALDGWSVIHPLLQEPDNFICALPSETRSCIFPPPFCAFHRPDISDPAKAGAESMIVDIASVTANKIDAKNFILNLRLNQSSNLLCQNRDTFFSNVNKLRRSRTQIK